MPRPAILRALSRSVVVRETPAQRSTRRGGRPIGEHAAGHVRQVRWAPHVAFAFAVHKLPSEI
jgi:hypothetical protein